MRLTPVRKTQRNKENKVCWSCTPRSMSLMEFGNVCRKEEEEKKGWRGTLSEKTVYLWQKCEGRWTKAGFGRNKGRILDCKLMRKLTELLGSLVIYFFLLQVPGSTVCVAEFGVNKWLRQNIITLE